jgi:hypothetical protein
MDAKLTFPSSTETATETLPDGYEYKVTKRSQTMAVQQSLVSQSGPTTADEAKTLEKCPPSFSQSKRELATITKTTKHSAAPSTASTPSQKPTAGPSAASSRDRFDSNLGRLSMHMIRRNKSGSLPGKAKLPSTTPTASKHSFWNWKSGRRRWAVPTDGDEGSKQ